MKVLLVLPVLIPLVTAILCMLLARWRKLQTVTAIAGAAGLLVAAFLLLAETIGNGTISVQLGSWMAPFGITFVADLFSAVMVVLAAFMGLAVAVFSVSNIDEERKSFGYFSLFHILLMGVCGAFLTGDIFNLYVCFEVMLIASFVLMILGGQRAQMEGAIKYVSINLISSMLFLAGIGILYGKTGTLNMADLAVKLSLEPDSVLVNSSAMLFLVAFGIKAAMFPFFFWLPASYHTPPTAISAIFAGLLTKVGVYALIRSFTLFFVQDVGFTHTLILILSGLTMLTGVLGAAAQNEVRRILSFHIISQIGYMTMGLGLFSPLALAGSLFYLMHHIVVKTNLFLVSGVIRFVKGTNDLKELGGLYRQQPVLALLFIIPAFSLAGIPPLSGFFAKFTLIKAGLELEQYLIVSVALFVGLLTMFSMTKIWAEAFWKRDPASKPSNTDRTETAKKISVYLLVPVSVLAITTITIGLAAEPFAHLAIGAAEQLLNPSDYIQSVLGSQK